MTANKSTACNKGGLLINISKFVLLALVSSLVGCASFHPIPINEPNAYQSDNSTLTVPDYTKGGLVPATKYIELKNNTKIYADYYMGSANKLLIKNYNANDIAFIGSVLGVVGGVAKSVDTAIAGAALASGSSIVSQRYQFEVQSLNYEKASNALYCMYRELYSISNNAVINSKEIVMLGNENIDQIRNKLRQQQRLVKLVNPDLTKLEDALTKKKEDEEKLKKTRMSLLSGKTGFSRNNVNNQEIELLKSKLNKCVATF